MGQNFKGFNYTVSVALSVTLSIHPNRALLGAKHDNGNQMLVVNCTLRKQIEQGFKKQDEWLGLKNHYYPTFVQIFRYSQFKGPNSSWEFSGNSVKMQNKNQ